jgi:hypothetical protein
MTHAGTRDANEAPIIYRCYELERFILFPLALSKLVLPPHEVLRAQLSDGILYPGKALRTPC